MSELDSFKDLGLTRSKNGLDYEYCLATAVKASKVIDAIKHLFQQNSPKLLWLAFISFILSMLSYRTHVWSSYLAKDIKTIQRVQRHCTKSIRFRNELDYKSRLLDLNAHSLQKHRTYTDRVFIYKVLHSKINCEPKDLGIVMSHTHTRGDNVTSWSNAGHPLSLLLAYLAFVLRLQGTNYLHKPLTVAHCQILRAN